MIIEAEKWSDAATSQEMPRTANDHQEAERLVWNRLSLEPLRRNQLSLTWDF